MKSLNRFASKRAGEPLLADDILEFHAGRILLLLRVCGIADRIDGLTKMAKLDFFVRYPDFFRRVAGVAGSDASVESSMTRFHYGPWDHRYYQVLAALEARGLLAVTSKANAIILTLTPKGHETAESLRNHPAFTELTAHMAAVKKHLGHRTGSALKDLIYRTFGAEVAQRRIGETIK